MFELADYLVGIYKVEDCTRSLTIQNCDKQRVLGLGEKEVEKGNFDDNITMLDSPLKQLPGMSLSPVDEPTQRNQSMDIQPVPMLNLSQPEPMNVDSSQS